MSENPSKRLTNDRVIWLMVGAIMLLAIFLRFWRLDSTPPGWRDDELINSLVISQHLIDGDLAVYYADASGHEALYHALNAMMLAAFGPGVAGIRWLSAILGVCSILLTFLIGRRLFGPLTGLVAAAIMTVSFWSLMYSRVGIRHILLPVLALVAYHFFLRGLAIGDMQAKRRRDNWMDFLLAGVFVGLSFYSYFASRGVPIIMGAFLVYVVIFDRLLIERYWRQLLLMFGLAILIAVPLILTLAQQPESEARVAELAVPLMEAQAGNFALLREHILTTLSMFHGAGDGEWLYNIPDRPVFGLIGALFFWIGVAIAIMLAFLPLNTLLRRLRKRKSHRQENQQVHDESLSSTFLLIWWLAGISPAFISVPPASLGHTILAQPAVYLLAALPVWWLTQKLPENRRLLATLAGLILILAVAARDLPDYFLEWPQRGMTRFLYRADIHDVADYLNAHPDLQDFSISGLLAGPWDKIALQIALDDVRAQTVSARWYDPQRALILSPRTGFAGFPLVESPFSKALTSSIAGEDAGGYTLVRAHPQHLTNNQIPREPVCFENGLCWNSAHYDPHTGDLTLEWVVDQALDLPPAPLISNPPPPDTYAGPRLLVFAQLQDAVGNFLVGDDGLWVDAQTLMAGDRFVQLHYLPSPEGQDRVAVVFGLYDPLTNERLLTLDGRDHITLEPGA